MACVSVQPEGSLRHDQPGVDESPLNDPEKLPLGRGKCGLTRVHVESGLNRREHRRSDRSPLAVERLRSSDL